MLENKICDLSHWNENAIFTFCIHNDKGVILKATQGTGYIDTELYKRFLSCLARKNIEFLGVYHYLDKRMNGDEQALHFYNVYKPLCTIAYRVGIKLVPIIDFEEGTHEQYHNFYSKWCELCDTSLVTYTSYSWVKALSCFDNRLLWCAGWTNSTETIIKRIDEYPTMILYQYTSKFVFENISNKYVDRDILLLDRFNELFYFDCEVCK